MAKKTAKDYDVTFAYKRRYPWGGLHDGEDRAMRVGVDVVVNGRKIGRSGNTGQSTGPHLHTDKYRSFVVNFLGYPRKYYRPTDAFKILKGGRVVWAGWLGTAGKCVIIKRKTTKTDKRRIFYRYLHLSEINVKRGDWV